MAKTLVREVRAHGRASRFLPRFYSRWLCCAPVPLPEKGRYRFEFLSDMVFESGRVAVPSNCGFFISAVCLLLPRSLDLFLVARFFRLVSLFSEPSLFFTLALSRALSPSLFLPLSLVYLSAALILFSDRHRWE